MTRKDYRLFAALLQQYHARGDLVHVHDIIRDVANIMQADSMDFNRETFYAACGVDRPERE